MIGGEIQPFFSVDGVLQLFAFQKDFAELGLGETTGGGAGSHGFDALRKLLWIVDVGAFNFPCAKALR